MNTTDFPTNIPDLTTAFLTPDSLILTTFKLGFVLVAVMYVVYSVVIVRQVNIMNVTVETQLGTLIQVVAWIHLAFAVLFGIGVLLFL